MGFIVDSTDHWSVEARQNGVTVTTDYGSAEIPNEHLNNVIATMLSAAVIEFLPKTKERAYLFIVLKNFLASNGE